MQAVSQVARGFSQSFQKFGDRINLHPHLHFLVTEGGVDKAGVFHNVSRIEDSRLAELFGREVLADLVRKELLSTEWAGRLLCWRHTGVLTFTAGSGPRHGKRPSGCENMRSALFSP